MWYLSRQEARRSSLETQWEIHLVFRNANFREISHEIFHIPLPFPIHFQVENFHIPIPNPFLTSRNSI